MSTLTWNQVAALALGVGWDRDEAATAVAIARAESGFRTEAVSPTRCCYGIWQVNKSHGDSPRLLMDPRVNATAARRVYNERLQREGRRWVDWSAYKNGSYRKHMRRARRAVAEASRRPEAFDIDGPIEGTGGGGFGSLGRGAGRGSGVSGAIEGGIEGGVEAVGTGISNAVDAIIASVWPVLLRVAVAGAALALIGYGIVKMTGSGRARTHVTQAASTAGAVGGS